MTGFARKTYSLYTVDMQKRSTRWFDLPALLFLAIATLIASARLVVTDWVPDLDWVTNITRLGLFMGVVFGYSRFKKAGVNILTFGYTLTLFPWMLHWVISPLLSLEERFNELLYRVYIAFTTFIAQEPVEDPIIVLIFFGLLFWSAAIYSNFALFRYQNGLAALLPSTLLILAIQYNDHKLESPLWMLGFYFFFAFLLLARLDYLKNRETWQKRNFNFDDTKSGG